MASALVEKMSRLPHFAEVALSLRLKMKYGGASQRATCLTAFSFWRNAISEHFFGVCVCVWKWIEVVWTSLRLVKAVRSLPLSISLTFILEPNGALFQIGLQSVEGWNNTLISDTVWTGTYYSLWLACV